MVKYQRTYKKKVHGKATSKAVVPLATKKYVKSVVNKAEESKAWISTWTDNTLKNGTVTWAAPLQALAQGTASRNRVGKKIHLNSVVFKGILAGAQNLYETYFRLMILEADTEATKFGQVAGAENHNWIADMPRTLEFKIFQNPGSNNMYALVNNSKVRIISDKVVKIHKDVMQNFQAPIKPFSMSTKLNRDIVYSDDASYSVPNGKQLIFGIVPYCHGVGYQVDTANISGQFYLSFKDA